MTGIIIVCLSTLRIIRALDDNSYNGLNCRSIEESRYGELQCNNISSINIKPFWFDEQKKCSYQISSTSINGRFPVECHGYITCKTNHYRPKRRVHCEDCFPIKSGDIFSIKCQASSGVNIDNIMYENEVCDASMFSPNKMSNHTICENSFTCSIENAEKTGSIDVICTVGNSKSVDDTTTDKYHVDKHVDDRSKESHVSSPVHGGSTESQISYSIPDDDTRETSIGFSNYAFIVVGIVGVLLVICIIVGVFLWRKCRSGQKTRDERVTPTLNPTYDLTNRPNSDENSHQANVTNDPGTLHCSTSHTVYFENRTDDLSYAKVNKSRDNQQPGIQTTNEESSTYPHPQNTADFSDDIYDHTLHNPVHDISNGDYGITHRRITEDDYDLSVIYPTSLFNDQDSVYS